MASFDGFVIVVTGGGSGIGLACVKLFYERGATVWTAELSPNPPEQLKAPIESGKVFFRGGIDVSSRPQCDKFLGEVVATSGRLDGLVNNAGINLLEGPYSTDEAFEKTMSVNVRGVWNYGTKAISIMEKQEPRGKWNSKGNIVNVSSMAGILGVSSQTAYSASKYSLIALTRGWSADFAQRGIRVNAIAPGK